MPGLNWSVFENLPGAADHNFEMLCRAIIRRHYASKGRFRALNNQPGVEFDLQLTQDCTSLGTAGQWLGWQCKWFDLPSGLSMRRSQRDQIVHSIKKTIEHFPEITHWVLWTRHLLTEGDQNWFKEIVEQTWFKDLGAHLTLLPPWSSAEIEEHLNGEAALLRETYFGELVLTPQGLSRVHSHSVAPVKQRWQPEVHQVVEVEENLRGHLAEPLAWTEITGGAERLKAEWAAVELALPSLSAELAAKTAALLTHVAAFLVITEQIVEGLTRGQVEALRGLLPGVKFHLPAELQRVPRHLRSVRSPAGLYATNMLASVHELMQSFFALHQYLSISVVAVVGEAGMGKTELAVALTSHGAHRPAGILLHGKDLKAGDTLDDLAGKVPINGHRVTSMEKLLAALDAAAARAGCRLPLVIDALNEAEDPRDWKDRLAVLKEMLDDYPNVVVVVTLRPAFAEDTVPEDFRKMELKGFNDMVTREAVQRYFKHYKLDPGEARFYTRLMQHPLTLRIYCEVTNLSREKWVKVQGMPRTLSDLFEKYFKQVTERIAALSSRSHRIHVGEVEQAIHKMGMRLWESRKRSIPKTEMQELLDPPGTLWENSMVRHLEQNGVLITGAGESASGERVPHVSMLYDLMAGHVTAEALVSGKSSGQFETWFQQPEVLQALQESPEGHPYAGDIIKSLTTLLPRRFLGQQLWKIAVEPLRTRALLDAAVLEARHVDQETVNAISDLLTREPGHLKKVLPDLREARALAEHPLNANFTSTVLEALRVTDRDVHWTEALRWRSDEILDEIAEVEERWKSNATLSEMDDLKALWISWYFTSTVQKLRDLACRAVYWYGRRRPGPFLKLVERMLKVNDPYVVERMMVAALGVVMAHAALPDEDDFVQNHLPVMGRMVFDHFFAAGSTTATTHILTLDYARRTLTIALKRHPSLLLPEEVERTKAPFPEDLRRHWGTSEDRYANRYREGDDPFGFDFRNYTLGRLVPGRGNYDDAHPEFIKVKGCIRWRIYDLGYTLEQFSSLDQSIARRDHSGRAADGQKTERYGKKYAWIAFHEMAGLRMEQKKLGQKEVLDFYNIDPSFPDPPRQHEIATTSLLLGSQMDTEIWLRQTDLPTIHPLLWQQELNGLVGPWLMLDGELWLEDQHLGRLIRAVIRMVLVQADQVALLQDLYGDARVEHRHGCPEPHSQYNAFASDLPLDFSSEMVLELTRDEGQQEVQKTEYEFCHEGQPLSDEALETLCQRYEETIKSLSDQRPSKKRQNEILLGIMNELNVEIEERISSRKERKVEHFNIKTTSPVVGARWEGDQNAANPSWRVTVPSLEIVKHFGWRLCPNGFDFEDAEGQLHSQYVEFEPPDSKYNRQNFAYIREENLFEFARARELEVVWVIHGERSRSTDAFHSGWGAEKGEKIYHTTFKGMVRHSELDSGKRSPG